MAKFRQYKNGIFGHRYKQYYILRNNANKFKRGKLYRVVDKDGNEVFGETAEYEDCEWFIDKLVATKEELDLYHALYDTEINQLYRMANKYSVKTEEGTIENDEKKLYALIRKIMNRKIRGVPFDNEKNYDK